MKYYLKIEMDDISINKLHDIVGKELTEIQYVLKPEMSLETYLRFNEEWLEVENNSNNMDCFGDEYSKLYLRESIEPINSPYKGEFKAIPVRDIVESIDIIKDTITWENKGILSGYLFEQMVVLHLKKQDIILKAGDTLSECVEIYQNINSLGNQLRIESLYDFNAKDVTYRREIRTIAKLED